VEDIKVIPNVLQSRVELSQLGYPNYIPSN
jgi:hypothetical protein